MNKRLPPGVVRAIRQCPCSNIITAREFGVSVSTVANIRAGNIHSDVPDDWPAPPRFSRPLLTPEQVRSIRASRAPARELAAKYGLSTTSIYLIRRREQIYTNVA